MNTTPPTPRQFTIHASEAFHALETFRADINAMTESPGLTGAHDAVAEAASAVQRTFARVPGVTVSVGKLSEDYYAHTHKV